MGKYVGKRIMKKDAMALVTGKPVYTDDIAPKDCLVVKLLRSPHAHALISSINTAIAKKLPGVAAVYTYEDVPDVCFTMAGQTYPEASPYDHLILDRRLRYVGDAVAIVAAETEDAANRALKAIKVKYEVLEPVLDFRTALDNPILVHPEENWRSLAPVGADNKRNLVSTGTDEAGDVQAVLDDCDFVIDRTYHTKACQQAMMETFRAFTQMDVYGRLVVTASTQIAFHLRRILSTALQIPKSKIRVIKPRIGGGFGAKQTSIAEMYPAFVTLKTGRPAKLIYTREECMTAGSPRHEMEMHVRIGANKDGKIRAIWMDTLSNSGAFGEHGPTTVTLSGHKSIPLYHDLEAFRFHYDVVYTNVQNAGAYRGYGATQGLFAVESAVSELAEMLDIDPIKLREMNMLHEGEMMPAYYGESNDACALDRCLARCKQMMNWDEKYPAKDLGNGKIRAVGVGMAMQGSGISGLDTGSTTLRVDDDGGYTLLHGAADMGTGCDTILAQIAADALECDFDQITVYGGDTDTSPYDSGSYASSTTYVTGMAVVKTAQTLRKKIIEFGAKQLGIPVENADFDGKMVYDAETPGKEISLADLSYASQNFSNDNLSATESNSSPKSPPPFMVGMSEIELDKETGIVTPIKFCAVIDCGTVINENLARIQAEGGLAQGIGMTLYEDIQYSTHGAIMENSLMTYKIPTRQDVGEVIVEFEPSYEPTGPFGAKSIGEIVINTPLPSITHAIYNAIGKRFYELPILPHQVAMAVMEQENKNE